MTTKKTAASRLSKGRKTPTTTKLGSAPGSSGAVVSITTADVATLESACTTFASLLGPCTAALTKTAVARLPKPKKNSSAFVNTVADLSTRFNLVSPTTSLTSAVPNLELVQSLAPAIAAVSKLLKTLNDTAFLAESNACAIASATYRVLVAEAMNDPSLATAIQPLRAQARPKLTTPKGTKTVKRSRSASAIAKAALAAKSATAASTSNETAASSPATSAAAVLPLHS